MHCVERHKQQTMFEYYWKNERTQIMAEKEEKGEFLWHLRKCCALSEKIVSACDLLIWKKAATLKLPAGLQTPVLLCIL